MSAEDVLKTKKIGVMGVGNLGQALVKGFIESGLVKKENIWGSSRNEKKLSRVAEELGIQTVSTNEALIDKCDLIVLGMKPQDLYSAIEPIASSFHEGHVVMSLAAGIDLTSLKKLIPNTRSIVRAMPNTAAKLRKSVIAVAATPEARAQLAWIELLLSAVGYVVPVEDGEMMEAVVVSSSSGVGFVFELMIYWREWLEERGFSADVAKKITNQVFIGAAGLAESAPGTSFEELLRKVTSAKGVTAAGLDSMRELELERILRISFEKAALRDQELGKDWQKP